MGRHTNPVSSLVKICTFCSKGSLTEPLCPDTDYSNGLELGGGGGLDNAVDTGANLDDVNCDYLGTCYDGENKFLLVFNPFLFIRGLSCPSSVQTS